MTTHVARLKHTTYSIILGVIGLLLISASFYIPSAHALTLDAQRDCDANAVIKCGALSTEELLQKYNNQPDVQAIFGQFGISAQDMAQIGSTAVAGTVNRDGQVTVNGKVIATNATTAGRQNISGSTQTTGGGSQFYMRSPSASFQTHRLKAFVVKGKNGQFAFAILASCGNPVKAKPVHVVHRPAPPAPVKPKPKQPKSQPAPQQQQQQQQSQSQQQSITINQTTPPPPTPPTVQKTVEKVQVPVPTTVVQPVATPAPAPVEELPKTGIETTGSTLGIAGLATLGGTLLHFLYVRRKSTL